MLSLGKELRYQTRHLNGNVVAGAVLVGILVGIFVQVSLDSATPVYATNEEVVEEKEVQIEVVPDWNELRIIEEIKKTFPEDPETAIKIAKCESGLIPDIQSQHQLSYGQERSHGLMQIHAPDWDSKAIALGFVNYKTEVRDNLKMARYIYDSAGKKWTAWSCYTKRMI
jgi:hypothetical protein